MSAGRDVLERWKAAHTNVDRYGDEMTYCVGCERGPWPCSSARLIAALEEALQWLPEGNRKDDVFAKLVEG